MNEALKLSDQQLFVLFNRAPEDTRWITSADSSEYLNRVIYLTQRIEKEMR